MQIQIKQLENRAHFVAPMVMIRVGVLAGTRGPVFYPAEELKNSIRLWNGKPVVQFHPDFYSGGLAGNPQVFNQQKLGFVFNTKFVNHELKAEAWIEVDRLKLFPEVNETIQNGKVLEVSTGLIFSENTSTGTFNGKQFFKVARNIVPDHLALLPGKIGACSIADGCGFLRNNSETEIPLEMQSTLTV